jgi:hypothetical protein
MSWGLGSPSGWLVFPPGREWPGGVVGGGRGAHRLGQPEPGRLPGFPRQVEPIVVFKRMYYRTPIFIHNADWSRGLLKC